MNRMKPPYMAGDFVAVKVKSMFATDEKWIPGVVTQTAQHPNGITEGRWALRVAVGLVGDAPLEARVYCDTDGSSETVRLLEDGEA